MSKAWENFCTLCICGPCKTGPRIPVIVISLTSCIIGLLWLSLGLWLTTIVILNSALKYDDQLFFEKLHVLDSGKIFFENEATFVFTPLDNLKFFLVSMSIIAILGGVGRFVTSICLLHYVRKKVLTYLVSWAWVVLSILAIVSLGIIAVDIFYTLSHYDLIPPFYRDFYFKNDNFGFYILCNVWKYFLIFDFISISYFQWVVRWAQRHPGFAASTTP